MKEIEIDELKRLQLDILIAVDKFCRINNLRYTLAFGTLIGAIRHKGYIPWDDDIDIAMPRPDYDKFVRLFNGAYNNLHVLAPELDLDYYAPYANVCDNRTILIEKNISHRGINVGVKIDIFPVDGVPDDENEYHNLVAFFSKQNLILSVKRRKVPTTSLISFMRSLFYKTLYFFKRYKDIQQIILKKLKFCPYEMANYVDTISFPIYRNTRFPKNYFDECIDIPFEGKLMKCISNYDKFLRNIYGDYMQFPPLEKQKPHHGFTAYWKD